MTNQQFADQKRLEEILKLARMQLNEEYMKRHSIAHTSWLTGARTAWTNSGVLLPFSTKFVYPSEEEIVARGVEIYNTLTSKSVAPAAVVEQPVVVEEIKIEPKVELLQAGGDFVLAEVVEEEMLPLAIEEEILPVAIEEEKPTVMDSLLESKFRSLFTKWGGKGNY